MLMSSGSISSGGATSSKVEVVADADGMSGTEAAVAFTTGAKGVATPTTFAAADGMFGPTPTAEGAEFSAGATEGADPTILLDTGAAAAFAARATEGSDPTILLAAAAFATGAKGGATPTLLATEPTTEGAGLGLGWYLGSNKSLSPVEGHSFSSPLSNRTSHRFSPFDSTMVPSSR